MSPVSRKGRHRPVEQKLPHGRVMSRPHDDVLGRCLHVSKDSTHGIVFVDRWSARGPESKGHDLLRNFRCIGGGEPDVVRQQIV